jgi:signal transduction histidine kinase
MKKMFKDEKLNHREKEIYDLYTTELAVKTDRIFAFLFLFQWFLGIVMAIWNTPKTWSGNYSELHLHIYMSIFLGGILAAFPIYVTLTKSGQYANRFIVAATQILFSMLLIHLTGGRIETHFHIFVSLAFLATYRDYRPILLATFITAADHLIRGIYWPESVYGVLSASPMRALEHSAWVVFEDIILIALIQSGIKEFQTMAKHQAKVEETLASVEDIVDKRTAELKESQQRITEQQQKLVHSSKMSSLGEMAGGVAHEINTPLSIISMRVEQLEESLAEGDFDPEYYKKNLEAIKNTNDRIAKIVKGLSFFARDGHKGNTQPTTLLSIIDDTLSFCSEKFKHNDVQLIFDRSNPCAQLAVDCRAVEISQVILNLLNNAYDALEFVDPKWVKIDIKNLDDFIEVSITDSGSGIPMDVQEKILQPFFTTKEVGKGTGLGLSISKGIVEEHRGKFFIDNSSTNTKFVVHLPKIYKAAAA